jgi:hypothetical protein
MPSSYLLALLESRLRSRTPESGRNGFSDLGKTPASIASKFWEMCSKNIWTLFLRALTILHGKRIRLALKLP